MLSKDEIISEIRRTAKENGGIPLGKVKFFQETGVKESDWIGKYWTKWSEATIEAGYNPNSMQGAYDERFLLEEFSRLVLELGHYPTVAEVKMKKSKDSDFPSHKTFNRFGPKKQMIGTLLEFARKNDSYTKVYDLIKDLPHTKPSEVSEEIDDATSKSDGFVYLLKFGAYYKIGNSKNVDARFRSIQTQMPTDGEIVHTITTGDIWGIEKYWHEFFQEKRLKGEWFELSASDVAYFKKRKLM